eukprot:11481349-Alexandrium_andersonii.AAC.1
MYWKPEPGKAPAEHKRRTTLRPCSDKVGKLELIKAASCSAPRHTFKLAVRSSSEIGASTQSNSIGQALAALACCEQ